ncbi:hypothetical protein IFO70_28070 [Phormidium tenue FACHB-886]|nr:hypothetical protein [Phormidium tenue FACHB-886]
MAKATKTLHRSFMGLGLTLTILVVASSSVKAQTIPPLTNPCEGVGGVLTFLTDLLPFQLFDRSYDCDVNPPETDSLL